MSMPIDIVFVDKNWTVLDVHVNVPPWRNVQNADAYAVIELAAGEASRALLRSGTAFVRT
jgi:uncharacterized membrane protein (UPF0127 family)